MKVAELLELRRENWQALERMCVQMERRARRKLGAAGAARFAAMYRAACADLALADAYQLPPDTIEYLHQLVGRAHNQLYRSRTFNFRTWRREMFQEVPARLLRDGALWLAVGIFWGGFLSSMYLAFTSPDYANRLVGEEMRAMFEENFSQPMGDRDSDISGFMAGFYIRHNISIGLQCFAAGLLLGIGGLLTTLFNAVFLGAVFGHMLTVPQGENFFNFVTAHGPFELTAIVLCAGAGMRLGFSLLDTGGLSRAASLRRAGHEAMPSMGAAMFLFAMAALIEGFLSPSSLPYYVKAAVAIISTVLLVCYVVVLGWARRPAIAT